MRRPRVGRLVLCGVVGVAATVLSTWGFAAAYAFAWGSYERDEVQGDVWRPPSIDDDWEQDFVFAMRGLGVEKRVVGWAEPRPPPPPLSPEELERLAVRDIHYSPRDLTVSSIAHYGWPMHSSQIRRRPRDALRALRGPSPVSSFDAGLPLGSMSGPNGAFSLPLRPAWPGFAVNAAIYAGVCWMLLMVMGVAARWRRRRRGRCVACGYDVGGLASCPECGASVAALPADPRGADALQADS